MSNSQARIVHHAKHDEQKGAMGFDKIHSFFSVMSIKNWMIVIIGLFS